MWQASLISAGLGFLSARKQRKQAKSQAAKDRAFQQEQAELLEQQKQAYRDITITNPYEGMQNAYGGLQTNFSNLAADAQNVYAGGQNLYEGMENRFEDMTVDTRAADLQRQMGQQQRANILQSLRGAAGTSGIAGLAQSLANQGSLQAQQISAGIGQQERQNQMLAAQEGSRIDQMQRGAGMQLQQLQMAGASEQQKLQLAGAQRAQALGVSRENLIARGAQQADMAERGGDAMLQQAEMSRQATLLGMQMGQSAGANQQMQQSLLNQQQANASAGQMMTGALGNLATGLAGMDFGGGPNASMIGGGQGYISAGTGGGTITNTGYTYQAPYQPVTPSAFINTVYPLKDD